MLFSRVHVFFSCAFECVCRADWVSVVAFEKTNLASTSNALCHVGAALLGAPLALCTSQHFSLFTAAHARPPLLLKSLQNVLNSLCPKGKLPLFLLLGAQPFRNTKEENCHCFASGGTLSDFGCFSTSCLLLVCVCVCVQREQRMRGGEKQNLK